MLLREDIEKREYLLLSPHASRSAETRGRAVYEESSDLRTEYQRDRDRIIHSKAFRRLMHKTQVFLGSEDDHYRTRLTHTLEVSQIARTISRALALNEDLAEAIALGHDLGHTPFGHNGETVLNEIHPGGFRHNEQSLRVVDRLESTPKREGMNLTFEVRDGILNHSGAQMPCTPEGEAVRLSDRIAYINHDIDDALRSGVISADDLPSGPISLFGDRHSTRIDNMVMNVITYSNGSDHVRMDGDHTAMLDELRTYMFRNVYNSLKVKKEEDLNMVKTTVEELYRFYTENPDEIPPGDRTNISRDGVNETVKDYIAGMTDRYALTTYRSIFG